MAMTDRSWLHEDDPWLVKAMHVTAELAREEAKLIKAVARVMDEFLKEARPNLVAAAGDVPDVGASWPPHSRWVELLDKYVLPIIEGTFLKAFRAAVEGVAAATEVWVSAFMTEAKDRLYGSKWPKDAFVFVKDLVSQAVDQGKSVQELAKELLEVLNVGGTVNGEPVWEHDALRIARTEVMSAYNGGTYNGAVAWQKATGQTRYKQWLATRDDRTRETHAIANRQVQPFDERFSVGAAHLQFPCDPSGPANEVIQCRCTLLILSSEEAQNGGLIAASIKEKPMAENAPHWRGVLAALDTLSGDDRMLAIPKTGEIRLRERKDLRYSPADWGSHDGAVVVGRIDRAWVEGNLLMGEGIFDTEDPYAAEVIRKMRGGFAGSVSVDLDDFTAELACAQGDTLVDCEETFAIEDGDDPLREVMRMTDWRLAGATLVSIPAFPEAFVELIEENLPSEEVLVAAGAIPKLAPKSWFQAPDVDRPTPITVSSPNEQGLRRVFGHVAADNVCHTGIEASRRQCVTVPESPSGYKIFNRIPYETAQGIVHVGRITTAYGALTDACACCPGSDDHACMRYTLNQALAHHDKMTTLAHVAVGKDKYGVWFAGVAADDLDERDLAVLSRQKVSGDWRGHELVEVLALSREEPGFPIPREKVLDGVGYALVAAGVVPPDPTETPKPTQDMDTVVRNLVKTELARQQRKASIETSMRQARAESLQLEMMED